MLYHNIHQPRDPNPTGKFKSIVRSGVQQLGEQTRDGWTFQLWRRSLGMTVKRLLYNVSIFTPDHQPAAVLYDFPSADQAREAAELWIQRASTWQPPWTKRFGPSTPQHELTPQRASSA